MRGSCAASEYNSATYLAINGDDLVFMLEPIANALMLSLLTRTSHLLLVHCDRQILNATRTAKHSQVCCPSDWPILQP